MAIKRKGNSRTGLSSDARSWLDGLPCGFFEFKSDDELESLWREHGDESKMLWRRGVGLPITLESLERRENAWLGSGESSEFGGEAFFVHKHYTDDEKKKLWNARGEKDSFRWTLGMFRPLPI